MNELLNSNASYVFFRELPASAGGPPGSLGRAADRAAQHRRRSALRAAGRAGFHRDDMAEHRAKPLNRLMLAQDTGGAIRGAVRADFFWGFGEAAAREAGRMKQSVRMWVLLAPRSTVPGRSSD